MIALFMFRTQRLLAGEHDSATMLAVPRWPLAELTPPAG